MHACIFNPKLYNVDFLLIKEKKKTNSQEERIKNKNYAHIRTFDPHDSNEGRVTWYNAFFLLLRTHMEKNTDCASIILFNY